MRRPDIFVRCLPTGGPGSAYDLTDRRAIDMQIASIRSLHMSPDGILTMVSDGGAKVRQITPDGMLHTIVGNGNGGALPTDGTLAASSPTYSVPDAVQAADGTIYVPSRSPVIRRGAHTHLRQVGPVPMRLGTGRR